MKSLTLSALILITALSFLIHGYSFSTGDQSFHLPFLYKTIDSSLFRGDYLFTQPEDQFTIFYKLFAGIIHLSRIDIQWLSFILYFIFLFLLILSFYFLSQVLLSNRRQALLSTALLSLPIAVAGTATSTFDIAFMPRFLVAPIIVWGLAYLIRGQYHKTAFAAGVSLTIHPLSAISLGLGLLGTMLFERKGLTQFFKVGLFALIPSAWFFFTRIPLFFSHAGSLLMDPIWVNILRTRTPYLFLSQWSLLEGVSLFLALIVVLSAKLPRVKPLVITAGTFSLIYLVFSEIIPLVPLLQLQPLRVWGLVYIIFPIAAIKLLSRRHLLGVVALALFVPLFINHQAIEFPRGQTRDWDKVQFWIRDNTLKSSLILTPPHRNGFRIHSQRSIVAEIKDGSSGLYDRDFALEWQQRISDLHPLGPKSTAEILQLAQKYGANYFVTFSDQLHSSLKEIYRNKTFIVYKL